MKNNHAMNLIGREKEQQILERLYSSNKAEFLALYGRRRIGKTFLIKQFFSDKKCTFFHITGLKDGSISEQLNHFTKTISKCFYRGSELKEKTSWLDAFELLTDSIKKHTKKNTKSVIFLDEFPWMDTHKSKLLQALDHYWNHNWSNDEKIKLIICGSSASWIIKKIINNKGGLHNRITRKILLNPFSLKETKQFLISNNVNLTNWHISQIYMVTGGVPLYLSFIDKGMSSSQAIENLAFTENAPLLAEFDNLFESLFDNAKPYIELIRIIAKHRYGISQTDIAKKSMSFSKGGRISDKLQELVETGFILSFKPYKHKKRGTYFKVIDEYCLFYFYAIEPIRNTLQEKSLETGYWQELQNSNSWYSWSGYAFEAIVYKHLSQIRQKLKIPVTAIAHNWRYSPLKSSNEQGAQIDLLFDRRDNCITLCEIKYSTKPFIIDKQYSAKLINKKNIFIKITKTTKQIFIDMICASTLQDNPYSDELVSNFATLDDLFL